MTTPAFTWSGKGLRLIDLLDKTERTAVLGVFPSERQFRAAHVKGDATEFVKHGERYETLDDIQGLKTRHVWDKTLEGMGYMVATALDGRMEVIEKGAPPPLRGSIAPGSRTESQVAYDYIQGLATEGRHPTHPVTQPPQRMLFVSSECAEYLRATGETVRASERDTDGDVAFIWPARNDAQVERVMRDFQLATLGSNEPDSGQLATVIASKAPKQFAIWKSGMADQWRMMDSLRDTLLDAATNMTSGGFADKGAGGKVSEALKSFQSAFQMMAEDAQESVPSLRAAVALKQVSDQVMQAAYHLDKVSPVYELVVHQTLVDSLELAGTISQDLTSLHTKYQRDINRQKVGSLDASNGLG